MSGGICTADIYISPNGESVSDAGGCECILAAYDEYGVLLGAAVKSAVIDTDNREYQSETISCAVNAPPAYVKCFLWESMLPKSRASAAEIR